MRIFPINITNEEAERILRDEVKLCHAPVTGVFVASAIFTEKSVYFEHNHERENPVFFEHSETRSLEKILEHEKSPKIKKIILAGGGNANKYKSYVPCYSCASALRTHTNKGCTIRLLELPKINTTLDFSFKELLDSYKALPFSQIKNNTLVKIRKEIQEKTNLQGTDIDYVTEITKFGKDNNISIYLTGSSTKRGGAGTLLNALSKQKYKDIDLLFIGHNTKADLEKSLEEIITRHYGVFSKQKRDILAIHNPQGVVYKKYIYTCGKDRRTVLDCAFSTNFKGTLAYHAYETKNWFHQLS